MKVAQPNIRFTTTSDGVDIAFWEIGSGAPLLLAQNRSLSHAELEWAVPSMAALYLELANYFRVVRFDPRGAGISGDPPGDRVTLPGLVEDIDSVTRALDAGEMTLVGSISLGPAAIKHAVSQPEMVTHLVLCDTGPKLSDLPLNAYVKATDALVGLGVVPSLSGLFPSAVTDDLPALEDLMRGSLYNRPGVKPRDLDGFDVSDVLGQVQARTLILKSQDSLYTDLTQTRALLAGIPNAEMRVVAGTMAPWLADRDSVVEAFVSFLTSGHHRPAGDQVESFKTVVFTDLVSSTEVLRRKGDVEARHTFREIEDLIAGLSSHHGGQVVKELGDGSLITFKSTRQALDFSLDLQERMISRPVEMRVGIAAGEPIEEHGDVHGAVVTQASRIADLAEGGEVIVSDSVRQLAIGKEFAFQPRGEVRLKGFDEALRVWQASRSHERVQ